MKNVNITDSEHDLQAGFAWMVFQSDGKEYTLQCCLEERAECDDEERRYKLIKAEMPLFRKTVNSDDNGMTEGLSDDANSPAFEKFGYESCWKLMKQELRAMNIKIN